MAVCEATFGARLIGLHTARLSVLAITAVALIAIPETKAADTSNNVAETEGVTVTAEASGSLTSVSPEESANQKRQVPGAFTVKQPMIWNLVARRISKICCNGHRAFFFNQKTAWRFQRFQFECRVSLLKTSRSV